MNKKRVWIVRGIFIGIITLILFALFYFVSLYFTIEKNKTKAYSDVQKIAREKAKMTTIHKIERFHGDEAYYVVFGQNNENNEIITFIPFDQEKDNLNMELQVIEQKEVYPKEKIIDQWKNNCMDCKLIKIVPGQLNERLVREVTYIDDTDRYVFEYLSLYDGKTYEKLRFKKFFE